MAITRSASVIRFGATADQYLVEMHNVNGQGANAFHEYLNGVCFTSGVNAGICTLKEKSDGSGPTIAEVYIKSNDSVIVGPGLHTPFKGGLLFTGPASAIAMAYLEDGE